MATRRGPRYILQVTVPASIYEDAISAEHLPDAQLVTDALRAYVDKHGAGREGMPAPEGASTQTVQTWMTVPRGWNEAIRAFCKRKGLTLSEFIRASVMRRIADKLQDEPEFAPLEPWRWSD